MANKYILSHWRNTFKKRKNTALQESDGWCQSKGWRRRPAAAAGPTLCRPLVLPTGLLWLLPVPWVDTCGRNLRVFLHSCNMYFFVICRRISSLQIPTLCRWQPVCSSWWWWAETSASACHAPQILRVWLHTEWTHMNTEKKQKTDQKQIFG